MRTMEPMLITPLMNVPHQRQDQ